MASLLTRHSRPEDRLLNPLYHLNFLVRAQMGHILSNKEIFTDLNSISDHPMLPLLGIPSTDGLARRHKDHGGRACPAVPRTMAGLGDRQHFCQGDVRAAITPSRLFTIMKPTLNRSAGAEQKDLQQQVRLSQTGCPRYATC